MRSAICVRPFKYEEKKTNAIVVEKLVYIEINSAFDIRSAIIVLGCLMVNFEGWFYPRLVKEFNTNFDDRDDAAAQNMSFLLRVVGLSLTMHNLSCILNVIDEASSIWFSKEAIASGWQYKMPEALFRLNYYLTRHRVIENMVFRTKERVLFYLFSSNILSVASNLNAIRCTRIYFLDKIEGKKSLCYLFMLTKVFEFFEVEVIGEDADMPQAMDVLTEETLYRLGYVRVHGVWCNLVHHPLREDEVADSLDASIVGLLDLDDDEEHLVAPSSFVIPSTSTGTPLCSSHRSSVHHVLQNIESTFVSMVAQQETMECNFEQHLIGSSLHLPNFLLYLGSSFSFTFISLLNYTFKTLRTM
ncbi:hypothetical protein FNV43_RR05765 [Rhamnella rubrinervis]|uniref:Uncharacterized protein n=1 Tax=Rhamnella rubrinervis TaxID=2594499 RepID=A0A8K0MQZ0_9ROSA|nr:hypothetical protein FNV43_RR05765 [Rhamnella rubrinervis]